MWIREFDLEKSKEKIAKFYTDKIKFSSYPLRDEEKDAIMKNIVSNFPRNAYIVSTDNTRVLITQNDKVKSELSSVGNDISKLKPGSLLYQAISTAYNIEKNISRWMKTMNINRVDLLRGEDIKVDMLGSIYTKDFMENELDNSYGSSIVFGTFISHKDNKVYNTAQDIDIVIRKVSNLILNNLRPMY